MDMPVRRRGRREWLLLILFTPLALLYVSGGLEHSRNLNTDVSAFDQGAYLKYARRMRTTGYSFIGGRNRMPLYPFLQSLVYTPGLDEEDQFRTGKRLNIGLSLALLIVLWFLLRRRLPVLISVNVILITAFMVFIFKAAYVQCELVYYFLSFWTFLLMLGTLRDPGWQSGAFAGLMLALTHLTKASALPGLLFFLAAGAAWFLFRAAGGAGRRTEDERRPTAGFAALGLAGLTFLAVVYPYISTSKHVFGRYFYNVNSTFYLWYDTQEQVAHGTRLHGDREGWPKMRAEEIPGPGKYFREHSAGQALGRVAAGLRDLHRAARDSYGYYKYLLLYAGFALVVVIVRPRAWHPLAAGRAAQVLFCMVYFAGYIVLFAWGSASLWGANRMGLQLFLPAMYCFAMVQAGALRRLSPLRVRGFSVHPVLAFNVAIACLLAPDIYLVLTSRLMAMAGGH